MSETSRDPDAIEAEAILARFEATFRPRRRESPEARRQRGLHAIAKAQAYLNYCLAEMRGYMAAGEATGAGHWASRAAHEAGYIDWATARLSGRPYLAPASARLPNTWTDAARRAGDPT